MKTNLNPQTLYELSLNIYDLYNRAYNGAADQLRDLVIAAGGLIDTRARSDRPAIKAVVDVTFCDKTESVTIQAIRYDDELGLMLLTDTELDNYQFDTGYSFENYMDFEGEDAKALDDAMKDVAYFRELDDGYTDIRATITNIILGLPPYLQPDKKEKK